MNIKALALIATFVLPVALPTAHHANAEVVGLAGLFKPKPKFLPVNQAFDVSASQTGDVLTVRFGVTDGHYVYKDKLSLALPEGVTAGAWQFSQPATMVDDPEFGKVSVFEQDVVATTKLSAKTGTNSTATLTWQGCAKAGLCYPPERVSVGLTLMGDKADTKPDNSKPAEKATSQQKEVANTPKSPNQTTTGATANVAMVDESLNQADDGRANLQANETGTVLEDELAKLASIGKQENALDELTQANIEPAPSTQTNTPQSLSLEQVALSDDNKNEQITNKGQNNALNTYELNHTPTSTSTVGGFGLDKNPILAIALLFLAGIALAFSACVYPMIPIVANIVAKSHKPTAMRGFILTLSYGLGVATSYGILGAVVAWFGRSLGIVGWLQNPWILGGFALFFVLLALQMWGLVRLSLPSAIRHKFAKGSQSADRHLGRVYGSFLVGALSALVVSPCVSAPLAGALWAVSVQGNVLLGFIALFALGAGLSLPLVVVGTTQGQFMPKSGKFMEDVKHFGGLMLLAVAILLINRVFLTSFVLILWALWFMVVAVFFYRLTRLPFVALGLLSGIWSACLMLGVAFGSTDAWQPLSVLTAKDHKPSKPDIKVHTLAQLDAILTSTPKVLVEVTADWCIECKIMEKTLFTNRPLALADWQVVKLDISQTSDHSREILARYELFGPPALLYYQEGQLSQKQLGEVSRAEFELALQIK